MKASQCSKYDSIKCMIIKYPPIMVISSKKICTNPERLASDN